jgi:hypothetical protein
MMDSPILPGTARGTMGSMVAAALSPAARVEGPPPPPPARSGAPTPRPGGL